MLELIVVAAIIYVIVKAVKAHKTAPEQQKQNAAPKSFISNDEFIFKNNILVAYNGSADRVVVPDGVVVISAGDDYMGIRWRKQVVLPRSVKYIGEDGIKFCDNILYEGTEAEWENVGIWDKEEFYSKFQSKETSGLRSVKIHFNSPYPRS